MHCNSSVAQCIRPSLWF